MTARPNETARDWYRRVSADRDVAAAKLEALSAAADQSAPHDPEQASVMRRLEELRLEAIEAEDAALNELQGPASG